VDLTTGSDERTERDGARSGTFKAELSKYMSSLGRKGGKISGARRKTNLSATQRRDIARRAAAARWGRKPNK